MDIEVLFHGRKFSDISSNTKILNATTDFLLETTSSAKDLFEVNINGAVTSYICVFTI